MSSDVEARLAEIEADTRTVRSAFVWLAASGESISKREAKALEAADAFARLLARLKEHEDGRQQQQRETNETFVSSGGGPTVDLSCRMRADGRATEGENIGWGWCEPHDYPIAPHAMTCVEGRKLRREANEA